MQQKKPDRRTAIADAALRAIAKEGARGLTHRAVDAEAGLPQGSTSYYCRRRVELLALALRRHAELDRKSLGALDAKLSKEVDSLAELSKHVAAALAKWVAGQDEVQLTARFELFLACSREPQLKPVIEGQRDQFVRVLAARLAARKIARPRSAAAAMIALIEGLLLERVRVGRAVLGARELQALLLALWSGGGRS
jgi:DNA-binding transcriptional regulator YbjK